MAFNTPHLGQKKLYFVWECEQIQLLIKSHLYMLTVRYLKQMLQHISSKLAEQTKTDEKTLHSFKLFRCKKT